ncbi:MAG TPA: dihydrodipicolinate synthase family protein [Gaiellaceae bacterium]|jgi:4-hydroxy-tetrahydrodipicolinate synthase|nr:dihydrodipicolinate synthase family protein [Gaiellaceae bacterium]
MTTQAIDRASRRQAVAVTGVVPPIPTPFRDGSVDLDSLKRELDDLFESVEGVLIGGSTGEASSLTLAERESVIRTVSAHYGRERPIVVSIADNSIENSRALSEIAGECEAPLLILSCPSYFPNSRSMLEAFFGAVAEFASADLCLYDNPVASNTVLGVDDVVALVRAVPRLTHIKMTDTSLEKVHALHAELDGVTILAGDDSVLWHQLLGGADGIMTAIPMIFPQQTARMWRTFQAGDFEAAAEEYRGLSHFIHAALGPDYPAAVKAVLHERGVIASPEVRLPLVGLSPGRRGEILAAAGV